MLSIKFKICCKYFVAFCYLWKRKGFGRSVKHEARIDIVVGGGGGWIGVVGVGFK